MTHNTATNRSHCLNCGTALQGKFCHICGQEDTDINLTFTQLVQDALGDIFTFDSRIVRTLVPLIFRPGFLTREFYRGRRAPYVPPVRLYLFISFLLFLCVSLLDVNRAANLDELNSLGEIQGFQQTVLGNLQKYDAPEFFVNITAKTLDNLVQIAKEPGAFIGLLLSRLPYLMFVLLPVFALLLWLHFPSSQLNYLQFLVFALHYHAFASLLNLLFIIVEIFFGVSVSLAIPAVAYFYTAFSMRIALQSSITGCLLKPFVLLPAYLLALNFGLFIFMLLNVMSFN